MPGIRAAIADGYDIDEISEYLGYDLKGARSGGYSDDEIIDFLVSSEPEAPAESDVAIPESIDSVVGTTPLPEGILEDDIQEVMSETGLQRDEAIDMITRPAEEIPVSRPPEMGTPQFTEKLRQLQAHIGRQRTDQSTLGLPARSLSHPDAITKKPLVPQKIDIAGRAKEFAEGVGREAYSQAEAVSAIASGLLTFIPSMSAGFGELVKGFMAKGTIDADDFKAAVKTQHMISGAIGQPTTERGREYAEFIAMPFTEWNKGWRSLAPEGQEDMYGFVGDAVLLGPGMVLKLKGSDVKFSTAKSKAVYGIYRDKIKTQIKLKRKLTPKDYTKIYDDLRAEGHTAGEIVRMSKELKQEAVNRDIAASAKETAFQKAKDTAFQKAKDTAFQKEKRVEPIKGAAKPEIPKKAPEKPSVPKVKDLPPQTVIGDSTLQAIADALAKGDKSVIPDIAAGVEKYGKDTMDHHVRNMAVKSIFERTQAEKIDYDAAIADFNKIRADVDKALSGEKPVKEVVKPVKSDTHVLTRAWEPTPEEYKSYSPELQKVLDEAPKDVIRQVSGADPEAGKPFTMEMYRATGRIDKASIYAEGVEGAILGDGKYYGISEDAVKRFGPDVVKEKITLKNPAIITSNVDLQKWAKGKNIPRTNKETLAYMKDIRTAMEKAGHDGVIINVSPEADMNAKGESTKIVREKFDNTQVISFEKVKEKPAAKAKIVKAAKGPAKFDAEKHTLTQWIRIKGGVDYNKEFMKGELDRMEGAGLGIINKQGEGHTLNRLVELAKEDGFLQQDESINKLLDRMSADIAGEKIYSIFKEDYFPSTAGLADVGGYAPAAPSVIEMPEIVEFAKDLAQGKYPAIKKTLRAAGGQALGQFRPRGKGKISLRADIFKDPEQAAKTLAHEIGHFVDFLPEETLSRGNILGRIASLKKHLQSMIAEAPDSTGELFAPKERARLRTQATTEALKLRGAPHSKMKDKFFRASIAPDISRIYKKKLAEEAVFRGLITKEEITAELKKLTQVWKPFDESKVPASFKKYRYSSPELYADAFSVLINSPQLLKRTAPKFYKALFSYMERKPEVKAVYDEIQARVTDKKAVFEKRAENIRAMFERGEKAFRDKTEGRERHFVERLKEELVDVNAAIIGKVKQAKKAGKEISPEDNPIFWLEEAAYKNSQIKEFLRSNSEIIKTVKAAGLTMGDLDEMFFLNRVIHDRNKIANPLGFTASTAAEQLEVLKAKIGEDNYELLEDMTKAFREFVEEDIIPFLEESEMLSPELITTIKNNIHYTTFRLVDFIEDKIGRGSGVGAHIFKQYGTLSEIASPFTATIMKYIVLVRAANVKISAKKTVDFLEDSYPKEISKADTEWNGKAQVPVDPKDPEQGMIRFLQDGKVEAYYVDKYIADSFNRNPSESALVAEVLRTTNIVWRELFVNRNPGFWLFNMMRDFERAAINLPGGTFINFLPEYVKGIKPAFKEAFNIPADITSEMNKKKMLISMESRWGLVSEDAAIERMLVSYGLKQSKWDNLVTKKFGKIWENWGNIGQGIERIPKIAGYRWLKKHTNLTEKEIGHVVRTQVGSPDFLRKGKAYNIYNNLFLFSNAIKEGWRGDIEAAKDRPSEYAWKRAKYNFIPKIVMYGAALGLLGAWMRESMDNISEFDKSNYITIPLGELENGKTVYLRVPQDETGRFLGGILWKALDSGRPEDIANIFDYMAGQAPTLTPTVGLVWDTIQYFSGKNPYDWFRGEKVIPEREFEAGGVRAHKEFLKHQAKQAGAGIIYKFPYDDLEKNKTLLEKILDAPILSNIIGRFLKVSDTGRRQRFKEVKEDVRKEAAKKQLDLRDRIVEHVNEHKGKARAGEIVKFYHKLKKEGLIEKDLFVEGRKAVEKAETSIGQFRSKYSRYASRTADDARIDAVIFARSNDEKVALLLEYWKDLSRSQYRKVEVQLRKEGHLSDTAVLRARVERKKLKAEEE